MLNSFIKLFKSKILHSAQAQGNPGRFKCFRFHAKQSKSQEMERKTIERI